MRFVALSLLLVAGLASAAAADIAVVDRGLIRRPAVVVSDQGNAVILAGRGQRCHSSCEKCKAADDTIVVPPRRRRVAVIRYQ